MEKQCGVQGCSGSLNANNFIILHSGGCATSSLAYYCNVCGRLHWWDNAEPILNNIGQSLFHENGRTVIKRNEEPVLAFPEVDVWG